jgi:hypothetical protein
MTTAVIDWLTVEQVAGKTGKHPVTLRRALECGELHGHQRKRRGRWQVHPEAVNAWIRGMDGPAACGCKRVLRRVA